MADWQETPEALGFLTEIDACERSSDAYAGRGWHEVAEAFTSRAADAECELEQLRCNALDAIADAVSDDRHSDAWLDAYEEADEVLVTVKDAIARARRLHFGDTLFEQADAA